MRIFFLILFITSVVPTFAIAVPSQIISVPSPDTQPSLTIRGDAQTYVRVSGDRKAKIGPMASNESRDPGITILGATLGIPLWTLKSEVGIDWVVAGSNTAVENPATLHAKILIPELAFCDYSPALAVGIRDYGPANSNNNQNFVYGLIATTLPVVGRISAGGYHAAEHAAGPNGVNYGVLISIDRPLTERLWFGVDYTGGKNINSGIGAGLSYAFSKRAVLMVGYNFHSAREYSGTDTVTFRASYTVF